MGDKLRFILPFTHENARSVAASSERESSRSTRIRNLGKTIIELAIQPSVLRKGLKSKPPEFGGDGNTESRRHPESAGGIKSNNSPYPITKGGDKKPEANRA